MDNDYAFDFAVRLDDLVSGCLKGGDAVESLQRVLKKLTKELDDPEIVKELRHT